MSPSEIAFLAVGLVIGAAVGAAIAEALRARPAPRRQVRVTISPNSVHARRSSTLADPAAAAAGAPIPGSPEDGAWPEREGEAAGPPPPEPGSPTPGPAPGAPPNRTRVPSPPVELPAGAVAVPVEGGPASPLGPASAPATSPTPTAPALEDAAAADMPRAVPRVVPDSASDPRPPADGEHPVAGTIAIATAGGDAGHGVAAAPRPAVGAVAVLDPGASLATGGTARPASAPLVRVVPVFRPVSLPFAEVGERGSSVGVRARPPAPETRPASSTAEVTAGVSVLRSALAQERRDRETRVDAPSAGGALPAPGAAATADPCDAQRRILDERCALATAAREHATEAADALREAQRAYDTLRERLDTAQAEADPRQIAARKDELHRRFREAGDAAAGADEAEAAAREWLAAINDLNARAREAGRFLEAGGQELQAAMPRLERLAVEADAARISAEGAEAGCLEARERLAACEEEAAGRSRSAAGTALVEDPHPFDALWPGESDATRTQPPGGLDEETRSSELPLVLRMLRGDRAARDRLVATLAAGDPEAARDWQLRLTALMDAIVARAIEDGYLDLADDDPFWGLFEPRERREIVGALSALGYRFDGLRGFADGHVPAARDLSLAVGYAGLDRMRIRTWPRESELASLYGHAEVAADEWLVDQADDLSLGRMVDALGSRAADLADVWNAWGRLRPALLSSG